MNVITCCKIVPDEEEIKVLPNRKLSFDEVPYKISNYDLNALESGRLLATETNGTMSVLSIGNSNVLNESKIRKDILSHGADQLYLAINKDCRFADSFETAKALASALQTIGQFDVIICGMGSNDLYLQETGIQTGVLLGVPVVNNVTDIKPIDENLLRVERTLEEEVEVLEIQLPAVLNVSSEINTPSIPTMRDIMKAGKKPVSTLDVTIENSSKINTLEELAPESQIRRQQIIEGEDEKAVEALIQFLKHECL